MTEQEERLYVKADLIDYANMDAVPSGGTYSTPSRSALLMGPLDLDDEELKVYSTGGYQGTILFTFEKGGYVWLLKDAFGSCSGCDGLLGCTHVSEYAEKMMNNAYAFETKNDAVRFLHDKGDGVGYWGWDAVAEHGIELLGEMA